MGRIAKWPDLPPTFSREHRGLLKPSYLRAKLRVIEFFDVAFLRCRCPGTTYKCGSMTVRARVQSKGAWCYVQCLSCGVDWHEKMYRYDSNQVDGSWWTKVPWSTFRMFTDRQFERLERECGEYVWP